MTESGEPVAKRGRGRPPLPETIRYGSTVVVDRQVILLSCKAS